MSDELTEEQQEDVRARVREEIRQVFVRSRGRKLVKGQNARARWKR